MSKVTNEIMSAEKVLKETKRRMRTVSYVEIKAKLERTMILTQRGCGEIMDTTVSVYSQVHKSPCTSYVRTDAETVVRRNGEDRIRKSREENYQVYNDSAAYTVSRYGSGGWFLDEDADYVIWPGLSYESLTEKDMEKFAIGPRNVFTNERPCYELRGEIHDCQKCSIPGFENTFYSDHILAYYYIDKETYLPLQVVYLFMGSDPYQTLTGKRVRQEEELICSLTATYLGWERKKIELPKEVQNIFLETSGKAELRLMRRASE